MNVVELFAGTKSLARQASAMGHITFTSDYDPQFETDYTVDIMKFKSGRVPFRPDFLWASPPCESFSVASIGKHWHKGGLPKSDDAIIGQNRVLATFEVIKELRPHIFIIENPRGMLRKLPMMQPLYRYTVTYCQYGDTRMKPTDLWSNSPNLVFKSPCKNGMTCHVAAPRGSSTGTQGIKTYKDRSRVPDELCRSVMEQVEALLHG